MSCDFKCKKLHKKPNFFLKSNWHAKCYGSLANKMIHDRYYVLEIHAKMSENLFDVGCGLGGDVMMCRL